MEWYIPVAVTIILYACIAYAIYKKRPYPETIISYGPVIALKTGKTGFFDFFRRFSRFFRIYGTFGVIVVVIFSVFITLMLFIAIRMTLIMQPEPTGIYEPQNILLIPGINEYVPSTIAVWLAFIITIAIHEFGHGILCRIENIRVKGMGVLIAVIPVGFFVEPDEDDLLKTKGMKRIRMFGAGITNNLVFGFLCFGLMIFTFGLAAPTDAPVIYGVYKNFSADIAGVPQNSVIIAANGVNVSSRTQLSGILNKTKPGDSIRILILKDKQPENYTLNLTIWPSGYAETSSGFMGIYYYDTAGIYSKITGLWSPVGILTLLSLPFNNSFDGKLMRILAFPTDGAEYFKAPFWGFFEIIQLLFWCGWINVNVGIFNAIPMIPLDGGYILKEGVERILTKRGLERYANSITGMVSTIMLIALFSLIALPYLLHM